VSGDEMKNAEIKNDKEKININGTPETPEAKKGAEGGAGDGEGTLPAEEADPGVLQKLLSEQTARADDYYNRLVRLQADFENFRRRTRQDMENFYKYASEQLIRALLPVLDNFERALAAEGDTIDSFKAGVEMIYRQLLDVLAAEGLAAIPACGEQFDPVRHEAVLQEESGDYPDNTVIEELRRGYFLKDKVIRPSMVKVARTSQNK